MAVPKFCVRWLLNYVLIRHWSVSYVTRSYSGSHYEHYLLRHDAVKIGTGILMMLAASTFRAE